MFYNLFLFLFYMSLTFTHENGIKVSNSTFQFSIDPIKTKETSDINFVTHAHRDHINITTKTKEKNYIVTNTTADVMKTYFSDFNQEIINYKDKIKIDDVEFEFKNSGHVAGSYLLNIYDDQKITVTGDLNDVDTMLTRAAEPENTDILVIESTYGKLSQKFPLRKQAYEDFIKWLTLSIINNKMPVIQAYSFGKAQEIIALINNSFDFNIGLTESAFDITNAHTRNNIKLKNYFNLNGNIKDMDVLILPNVNLGKDMIQGLEYSAKKPLAFASVTGQDFSFGKNFKISDHADCNGLLNFVEACNPKQVYTYHGHSKELAELIESKLKIKAEPLKEFKIGG